MLIGTCIAGLEIAFDIFIWKCVHLIMMNWDMIMIFIGYAHSQPARKIVISHTGLIDKHIEWFITWYKHNITHMFNYYILSNICHYLRIECIFLVVLLTCKSVDRSTYKRASYKTCPRSTLLQAYATTTTNAFNSYNYI